MLGRVFLHCHHQQARFWKRLKDGNQRAGPELAVLYRQLLAIPSAILVPCYQLEARFSKKLKDVGYQAIPAGLVVLPC